LERKKTILCLENAGAPRETRCTALENAGFDVILTDDVREALRIFISHELDAVLMDFNLGNGKKKSLRAEMNSIRPRVPIIALCPPNLKRSSAVKSFDHTFRDGKGNDALIAILRNLTD
jgi:DNA-binding response OmpR family regulator